MSADLLRRAAEKLREHANAIGATPWGSDDDGHIFIDFHAGPWLVSAASSEFAEYIALMHPPVALALADLMERIYVMPQVAVMPSIQEYAEAMARAILREGPGSTSPEPGSKDSTNGEVA